MKSIGWVIMDPETGGVERRVNKATWYGQVRRSSKVYRSRGVASSYSNGLPVAEAFVSELGDAATNDRLREAVRSLYYAARWNADRPVDEAALWEAVRDAAGFEPGASPKGATR